MLVDHVSQDRVMLSQQCPHRVWLVLPATRRTLDIGEQERDGAGRRLHPHDATSQLGFIDLLNEGGADMEVVAVRGFQPSDPDFYERFKTMPVRPSVFGVTIVEERPIISNDVERDPLSVGTPPGHPTVRTFLGVPLRVGSHVIGMIGVGNKSPGYESTDERLLST